MKNQKPRQNGTVYDSLKAASSGMHIPERVLKKAKTSGCPAFRSNRVYADELLQWLESNQLENSSDPKDEKLLEEIRKLRLANDQKEGRLIERAWMAERIQRAAGELNAYRAKSEAEHPVRFAAAAGDVAQCRTVVRGIWDEIFSTIAALSKHFNEGAAS